MPERGEVAIVGSGLAGSEAAWQLAQLGRRVDLYAVSYTHLTLPTIFRV